MDWLLYDMDLHHERVKWLVARSGEQKKTIHYLNFSSAWINNRWNKGTDVASFAYSSAYVLRQSWGDDDKIGFLVIFSVLLDLTFFDWSRYHNWKFLS